MPVDKKIIGFDLDGVIVDHSKSKIRFAGDLGFKLGFEQTPSEIIKNVIPRPKLDEIQKSIYHDSEKSLLSDIMPGVSKTLADLKAKKIPYFLISRRREEARKMAVRLLEFRGLWPEYFNSSNVFFVASREEKNIRSLELGVTHYIDDEPYVLDVLVDVKHRFLFDQFSVFEGFDQAYIRVRSWTELENRLL